MHCSLFSCLSALTCAIAFGARNLVSLPHNEIISMPLRHQAISLKINCNRQAHDITPHKLLQFILKHVNPYPSLHTNTTTPAHLINMSGNSNVGNSGVYQADDQRTVSDAVIEEQKKENRFHEGKENSHKATDASMFTSAFRALYCVAHIQWRTTF